MTRPTTLNVRVFRLLLKLYPGPYRRKYGREMELFFEEAYEEGRTQPIRFWLAEFRDHVSASRRIRRRYGGEGTMMSLVHDMRWAMRALRRTPGFTVFATVVLALGVGTTTAAFTALDRVALRPLPYQGADRLLYLGTRIKDQTNLSAVSPALMAALLESPGPAEAVVGLGGAESVLTGIGDPTRVNLTQVTAGYFEMWEGRPILGRLLTGADHEATAAHTLVVSEGYWRSRLGGDPDVVGRVVNLNGRPTTIVGVVSKAFRPPLLGGSRTGELFVSMGLRQSEPERGRFFIRAVARLQRGASKADMNRHVSGITRAVYPPSAGGFVTGAATRDLKEVVVGDVSSSLQRALAAVTLLLVIACVNVSNLLLARGSSRHSELTVRGALGASRRRIARQLTAENVILGAMGSGLGALVAVATLAAVRTWAPPTLPRLAEIRPDALALCLSCGAGLCAVIVVGLIPSLQASRRATTARSGRSREDMKIQGGLVFAETALAVTLVVGSALLAKDLIDITSQDPGFAIDGLVSAQISVRGRPAGESSETAHQFWRSLTERARSLPGVSSASLVSQQPFGSAGMVGIYTPEGMEDAPQGAWVPTLAVGGDYLSATNMRPLEGRLFTPAELEGDRLVTLVNASFVDRYWPNEEGAGRRIKSGGPDIDDEGTYEVVGVVPDVSQEPGLPAEPLMIVPMALESLREMFLLLGTDADPALVADALRNLIRQSDPGLPITSITTVEALARDAVATPRFLAVLFGSLAAVALSLALAGIYGTTAYSTEKRQREIGIRLALGAPRSRVVRDVTLRAGAVVLGGTACGLGVAALASTFLSEVLRQTPALHPGVYGAVAIAVVSIGSAAAWLPANTYTRVDPMKTLRPQGP